MKIDETVWTELPSPPPLLFCCCCCCWWWWCPSCSSIRVGFRAGIPRAADCVVRAFFVNNGGPSYLSDLLNFYIPSWQLCSSSDFRLLRIPSFRPISFSELTPSFHLYICLQLCSKDASPPPSQYPSLPDSCVRARARLRACQLIHRWLIALYPFFFVYLALRANDRC